MTTGAEAGERLAIALQVAFGGCPHWQAEPVILNTGELVACVCISCLRALPYDWISDQLHRAHREAYCTHEWIETPTLGRAEVDAQCRDCGTQR